MNGKYDYSFNTILKYIKARYLEYLRDKRAI